MGEFPSRTRHGVVDTGTQVGVSNCQSPGFTFFESVLLLLGGCHTPHAHMPL